MQFQRTAASMLAAIACSLIASGAWAASAPTASAAGASKTATAQAADRLPLATGIIRRTFENGFAVMLYPRKDPTNTLEARLVVRAGSLDEADNERGLAHFVEHMAFNGTQAYPGQTIFKRLEAHGIMLGTDVNAVTSLGSTTYKLSIPGASEDAVEAAVRTMSEWAFRLTFDPKAFDREREIIVEEWRLRQGIGSRINGPLQTLRYKGSAAENRDPIGTIDVVRHAPVERAKAFYERHYAPQNMTLVLVGDFDAGEMLARVENTFAKAPRRGVSASEDWGRYRPLKDDSERDVLVFDKEQSDRFVQVMLQRTLDQPMDTVNAQWRDSLERLALEVLSARFELMTEKDLVGSLQTSEASSVLSPSRTQVLLLVRPKFGERYEPVLEAASAELKRLAKLGPTDDELKAAMDRRLAKLRDQAHNYARFPNAVLADDAADAVAYRLPLIDKRQELQMIETFFKSVTPDHIRAAAQALLESEVRLAAVGPDDAISSKTTASGLRAAWMKGAQADPGPFTLRREETAIEIKAPAMPQTTEDSTVPSPTGSGELRRVVFANGLHLYVLGDPELSGRVNLNLRVSGGTSAVEPAGLVRVPAALSLPMRCGIGDWTPSEVRNAAQRTRTSILSYAELLHHGIRAETDVENLPTMLALLNARLAAPHFCSAPLTESIGRNLAEREHAPVERRFMDEIAKRAFVNGRELVVEESDFYANGTPEKVAQLEGMLLGDPASMVVTVAGPADADSLYEAVAPWLGSLKRRAEAVPGWRDEGVRPAPGAEKVVLDWATSPKTMVQMHYSAQTPWTPERADMINVIAQAVNLELREKLRTELSGVYTVSMNQLLAKEPTSYYLGRLNFTTAPERAEAVLAKAESTMRSIAEEGLSRSAFNQAKRAWRLSEERQRRDAYYWAEAIAQCEGDEHDVELLADFEKRLDAVDRDATNAFLKTLLSAPPKVYVLAPKQGEEAAE